MRKLSDIEGMEDRTLMFVKFTNKQYVDDILDGKLYMNNIKYFIELENKTNIKGQGDKFEGGNIINDVNIKICRTKTKEVMLKIPVKRVIARYSFYDTIPLFCLTSFQSNDFNIIEETSNSYKLSININKDDMNKISKTFGEKAIVINPLKFMNRINQYYNKNKVQLLYGNVSYEDFNENNMLRYKNYANDSQQVVFTKDLYFKYQREFRIVPVNRYVEDHFIAEIGSLRDGEAFDIDTKEFFNGLNLEVPK